MAQFFDYRVSGGTGGETLTSAWCTAEPVLAVASTHNAIQLFSDEGERVGKPIQRSCAPVALAWQPGSKLLASGWQDGTIQIINMSNMQPKEDQVVHSSPITCLKWTADGTRLISGDQSGVVGVWKPDGRGRLSPICHYNKPGSVNHVVFVSNAMQGDGAGDGERKKDSSPAITSFFFGGDSGTVCYADDMGHCTVVTDNLHSAISVMDFYEEKHQLVIITKSLLLTQLQVGAGGVLTSVRPAVKLAMKGDSGITQSCWVGAGLLATSSPEESLIRVWDLDQSENYTFSLHSADSRIPRSDRVAALAFNPRMSVLAAGTRDGRVVMWKHYQAVRKAGAGPSSSAAHWENIHSINLSKPVQSMVWGPGAGLLSCLMYDDATVLNETILHRKLVGDTAAIQVSRARLVLERPSGGSLQLNAGINIKGMDMSATNIIVWNGKKAEVYEVRPSAIKLVSSFDSDATSMALHGENVFCTRGNHVVVCNLHGTVKQTLSFTESEGAPQLLSVLNKHLAVTTSKGRIKVMDVSRVQPRQVGSGGDFVDAESGESLGKITSISINADGTRVSLLASRSVGGSLFVPENRVFVYNLDMDSVATYDCGANMFPRSHYWDPNEPKLFAVETYRVRDGTAKEEAEDQSSKEASDSKSESKRRRRKRRGQGQGQGQAMEDADVEVVTLFATPRKGVIMQDSFGLEPTLDALLGLNVPKLYFVSKPSQSEEDAAAGRSGAGSGAGSTSRRLVTRPLRDFVGLDQTDETTRQALLDFSYYLAIGNMDEAYKAVKLIENPSVWENMAHMCVKSKRLDVAEVCLGNMGHARGARAVREAKAEPEHDAAIAMVAVQLGLLSDAARLYQGCKRFDLLNKLYQASGHWDKALTVAQKQDRIHLKSTHYLYAKHLESVGDTAGAIKHYELSDTHRYEVPRMLYDSQHLDELEAYINAGDDKELLKWWAQYCESKGQFDKAMKFYQRAGDVLALCRVYCYNNDFASASELVLESGSQSAAYHLARQHEANGSIKEAIQFFERAGRFNHAVRLAKEEGYDAELMNLALQSSQQTMLEVARYFEGKGVNNKAVQLYQKGGNVPKALDLCFRANLFDDLRLIADELGDDTPPEVLSRCSDFFIDHGQFEKAVQLQITAKKFNEALDLCLMHKVTITEDMAERMTPPKPPSGDAMAKAQRVELLKKMARVAKRQGSYHLATKKYTQAGDKMKAMKALLKSGDTEKIIFFAGVSRSKEIYILAANFLQTLDWHNEPDIMKAIINFYTKSRAFDQLSGFYDACAQVEIDEYRNYEKALGALREALKFLNRGRGADKERRIENLNTRVQMVDQFVQARKLVKTEPEKMESICHSLLQGQEVENSIRVGDVFALLIEFYYSQRNMRQAYELIEDMRNRKIILSPYLDQKMVNSIYQAVGVAPADDAGSDDGIDEEIDEVSSGEEKY